jgi:hypothetical protein
MNSFLQSELPPYFEHVEHTFYPSRINNFSHYKSTVIDTQAHLRNE